MNLEIDVKKQPSKAIVTLSGEIDLYTAPQIKEELLPLTMETSLLEIDLTEVSYLDSTGLGVFIHLLKSIKEHEHEMKLLNPQKKVLRLFTITGLDKVLNVQPPYRSEG